MSTDHLWRRPNGPDTKFQCQRCGDITYNPFNEPLRCSKGEEMSRGNTAIVEFYLSDTQVIIFAETVIDQNWSLYRGLEESGLYSNLLMDLTPDEVALTPDTKHRLKVMIVQCGTCGRWIKPSYAIDCSVCVRESQERDDGTQPDDPGN